MNSVAKTLGIISIDPKALKFFLDLLKKAGSLPNIPFPTMGGEVFWNTYVEVNGWKLQQNMIFKNARILNSNNIRVAWGSIDGMTKTFNRFAEMHGA